MLYFILLVIPSYFANAAPVILGGGRAIDGGKRFIDGWPILGKSKTIRGYIAGVFTGMLVCELLYFLKFTGIVLFMFPTDYVIAGFLLGFGSMLGDSIGSFIKRRLRYKSGEHAPLLDELLFVIVALLLVYPMLDSSTVVFSFIKFIVVLILTFFLHKIFNVFANISGYKKVPW